MLRIACSSKHCWVATELSYKQLAFLHRDHSGLYPVKTQAKKTWANWQGRYQKRRWWMGNIIGPQVCSNCELFDNKIASLEKQNCIFRKYSDMTYLSTIAAAQHSQIFGDMEAGHITQWANLAIFVQWVYWVYLFCQNTCTVQCMSRYKCPWVALTTTASLTITIKLGAIKYFLSIIQKYL